jgi:hypothetical protein
MPDTPEQSAGSSASLPPAVPAQILEAAATLMENGNIDLATAAARFGIPPESLHRYSRARQRHLDPEDSGASGEAGSVSTDEGSPSRLPSLRESGKSLATTELESFHENWERSARIEPKSVAPTPAAVFCSRHASLRWLVRDNALDPTITFGICVLLAGGAVAAFATFRQDKAPGENQPGQAVIEEKTAGVSSLTPKAEEVLRAFLAAKTPAAKRPFLRDPDTNVSLMEKWLANGGLAFPSTFKYLFFEESIEYSGKRFLLFSGLDELDSVPTHLIVDASVEPYLVDWQATVAYQPKDWRNFLITRPPGELPFRVLASLSNTYTSSFAEPDQFLSLFLTIPGATQGIQAYVARDSELGRKIATTFLTQSSTARTVTRLFPYLSFDDVPDGEERVTITRLAAEDWMLPSP